MFGDSCMSSRDILEDDGMNGMVFFKSDETSNQSIL